MTYLEFRKKWLGRGIDFDGAFKNQCQDVYRMYVKEVLGVPQSPAVKGAKEVWTTYLPQYFDKVPNTPDGVPEQGDIIVWGHGQFGHIAICDNADKQFVTSFEQNWIELDGSGVTELRRHNYTNILGWLKFKGGELEACLHLLHDVVIPEKEGLQREYETFKKTAAEEIKKRDDHIADLEQKVKSAETDRDETAKSIKALKEEDFQRVQSLAQKLLSRPDWAGVIAEIDRLLVVEDQKRGIEKELFSANEKIRGMEVALTTAERLTGATNAVSVAIPVAELIKRGGVLWQKILKVLKIR